MFIWPKKVNFSASDNLDETETHFYPINNLTVRGGLSETMFSS